MSKIKDSIWEEIENGIDVIEEVDNGRNESRGSKSSGN